MGVQEELPSNNQFIFQEHMKELLKAPLDVRKQSLASAQSARERQKRPRNANSWQIGFSEGLGKAQQLVFPVVSSLSTMSRSSPYVQT
jgi:hypothetical protein